MPGVLLIETMAQTSGWLVIGATRFTAHAVPGRGQGSEAAHLRHARHSAVVSATLLHEGSGFAVTKAEIKVDGKRVCNAEITFRVVDFPSPEFRASMEEVAAAHRLPDGGARHG